ncbi:hypothetical protein MAPG_00706 [Magnaporthiopsis poae ATCC 64411]|uniref:Myb-like domain-containing protein n=1 Tax=Magnaporthiopsis poae (strain ATCC 64411 / 73-15) TaxID=644358 RepID=A0A0C4DLR1_MAGP6|nr:hypothetical protein MAPG_00706 [Magnaporthiopsis poae ATCC 64411]
MPRTSTWTGDAEKELLMALWRSASSGPVRPDWTKAGAIMQSRGFGFTLEAMKCRWSKKLMKELYSLDKPDTAAAKASPGRKRKRVVDDEDDDGDAAPSTPKKPITTGLQTPDSKKVKASKSGGATAIKQEAIDIPGGSDHDQQQDEPSPEPSPTARVRVRRSNPGRSAAKAQSYKEWSGEEDSGIDGSVNDESFGDDSDVVV